jgi:DNA segregation ATPase FtsK/SpoIIIE-like protein
MNRAKSAIRDKLDCDVQVWAEDKNFVIEMAYNPIPKELDFDKQKVNVLLKDYECAMYLGDARRGPTIIDFTHNLTPHLLFGGPTGGGKSNLLNQGICGMSYRYTPEELNFVLIDLKDGIELGCYYDLPHTIGFCETVGEAEAELETLLEEIPRRNQLFKEAGVKKLTEYNSIMEEKLPRILVIADEFAQFNNIPDKKYKTKLYSKWEALIQLGRSAGIHVILGTQVTDADVFPTQIKGNIDARFGFRFSDPQHSKMITGGSDLTTLPNIPGRGMFKLGNLLIPTQVPRIYEKDINEILNLFPPESPDEFMGVIELEEEEEVTATEPEGIETLFQTEDSWRKS